MKQKISERVLFKIKWKGKKYRFIIGNLMDFLTPFICAFFGLMLASFVIMLSGLNNIINLSKFTNVFFFSLWAIFFVVIYFRFGNRISQFPFPEIKTKTKVNLENYLK